MENDYLYEKLLLTLVENVTLQPAPQMASVQRVADRCRSRGAKAEARPLSLIWFLEINYVGVWAKNEICSLNILSSVLDPIWTPTDLSPMCSQKEVNRFIKTHMFQKWFFIVHLYLNCSGMESYDRLLIFSGRQQSVFYFRNSKQFPKRLT